MTHLIDKPARSNISYMGFLMGTAFVNLLTGFINLHNFGPTDGFHTLTTMLGIPQTWDFDDRIRIVLEKQRIRNLKGTNNGILRIAVDVRRIKPLRIFI